MASRTTPPTGRRPRRTAGGRAVALVAGAAGRVVAPLLGMVTRLRGTKPMHPRGATLTGRLQRSGLRRRTGIGWLDATGTDEVLVRLSRGAGLPARFPDLLGLAVRVPGEHPVDLLLSSTGTGRWTRRAPLPRRDAATSYGSIMAYRTAAGPVWLSATADGAGVRSDTAGITAAGPGLVLTLCAAIGRGPWEPFARLTLGDPTDPPDPRVHFDAVLHAPPGLAADGPMARFRRPAYATARAVLAEPLDDDPGAR